MTDPHLVYTDHCGLGKDGVTVTTLTGGPHGMAKGDTLTIYGERWLIDPVSATTLRIYRATWWRRLAWWLAVPRNGKRAVLTVATLGSFGLLIAAELPSAGQVIGHLALCFLTLCACAWVVVLGELP